jgi:hypothetical protein
MRDIYTSADQKQQNNVQILSNVNDVEYKQGYRGTGITSKMS